MFTVTIGAETRRQMKVLGIVDYPFTQSELKLKYRAMCLANHPDVSDASDAEAKMKAINAAYDRLKNLASDDPKKAEEIISKPEQPKDMFDILDTCPDCKGVGNNVTTSFNACPDCEPRILQFLFGPRIRRGTGMKKLLCKYCNGTGTFHNRSGNDVQCRACAGSGIFKYVICKRCSGAGYITNVEAYPCDKCSGTGQIKITPFNPVIRRGSVLI